MKKVRDIYAIKIIFFITACYVGLWVIRIPTIKDQLQTDYIGVGYIMYHLQLVQLLQWFLQMLSFLKHLLN